MFQSRYSEIDRLGHSLAKVRNHHIGLGAQGLDDRVLRQPAGSIGAVQQGEDAILAGDVGATLKTGKMPGLPGLFAGKAASHFVCRRTPNL